MNGFHQTQTFSTLRAHGGLASSNRITICQLRFYVAVLHECSDGEKNRESEYEHVQHVGGMHGDGGSADRQRDNASTALLAAF